MNEKGGENLTIQTISTLIILLMLFGVTLFFVVNNVNCDIIMKQVMAKQICLITIEADKNTNVTINTDMIIETKENGFLVKKSNTDVGYYYPCYTKGNIEIKRNAEGKNVTIQIQ